MHEAYGRRLTATALRSTSGQNGYSDQTMYHVFNEEHGNESDEDTVRTITQTSAIMAAPGSTSTSQGTAISAEVAAAINQLSANQTTMMAQMAAMTMAPPMVPQTRGTVPHEAFHVPPILQVAVPMHQPFAAQAGFRDATAAVWVVAKAGADVEVEAARRLQMPCAAPEQLPHQ